MGRKKKAQPDITIDLVKMRKEISELINSYNFCFYDGITESVVRSKTSEITEAVRKKYDKYFTVTEQIEDQNWRPPFQPSWKIESK